MEVSFYKVRGNEKGHTDATGQYNDKAPALLHGIRDQVSKVRRYADPEVYQRCWELHYEGLVRLDAWLSDLIEKGTSSYGDWTACHNFCFEKVGKDIDEALYLLARDFDFVKIKSSKEAGRNVKM